MKYLICALILATIVVASNALEVKKCKETVIIIII
jgi:hypothetical protein